MLSTEEKEIIRKYLSTSLDDLLVSTGRILLVHATEADVFMASTEPRKSSINRAHEFIDAKWELLRKKLCQELNIKQKIESGKYENEIQLIAIIADAIASINLILPPFTLAVIITKMGIDKLCHE